MAEDTPTEGLPDVTVSDPRPGGSPTGSKYRPIHRIGQGGHGEVWLAQQVSPVTRQVALKFIKPGMDSQQVIARFESERQALALMDHPNIARIYDAGTTVEGRLYFAMEYVEGLPVTTYCDERQLTTGERLQLFIQICHGVQHAHQKAIIHRDIKPSNVIIADQDGKPTPKIIDFGIAKAMSPTTTDRLLQTRAGHVLGTPAYMSPEQADDSTVDIDTRSDVYSLGVLLYEMLVGAMPFETTELKLAGAEEIRRKIREEDPPRPSARIHSLGDVTRTTARNRRTDPPSLARHLRGDLDWIVMKALEKERTRRYGSPNEFAADIERHLGDQPVVAGPPDAPYRLRKFVRRHRVVVGAAAIVFVSLILGLGAAVWGMTRATRAEADAREGEAAARQVSEFLVELFETPDPTQAQGRTITAREVLDRGVERIGRGLDDQPRTRARLLQTMGRVYRVMGLYDEAAPLLEDAVELRGDRDDLELAAALVELGTVRAWQGDHEQAERLARRSLALRERRLDSGDPAIADSLNTLGNALQNLGRLDDAEEVHRRALAVREAALGPNHADIAQTAHNLAIVRYSLGDLDEAERLYKRSAAIEEAAHGVDNHNLATSLHTLAILYESQRRFDEAIEYEQRALSIREKVLGPGHPHVSFSLTTLGNLHRAVGRPAEAEPLLRRAVAIGDRSWDPLHPEVRWMRRSLASCLSEQQRDGEAEAVLQWLLAHTEERGEEEILPTTLNALGTLYARAGRTEQAEAAYRRSLEIDERAEGPDSPYLAEALGGLAGVTCDRARSDDAITLYDRALSVLEGVAPPDDPDRLQLVADRANCLKRTADTPTD